MADYPHRRDPVDHGVGFCLADAGNLLCTDRVIVGEFIGAERGIGRLIIESEARGEASGMMVAVIILMLVGVILSALIWRLQAYLLRWQRHNMAE